jgi:hypothetical protein
MFLEVGLGFGQKLSGSTTLVDHQDDTAPQHSFVKFA